jgi:uncharacterized protein (TIGR02246 family)
MHIKLFLVAGGLSAAMAFGVLAARDREPSPRQVSSLEKLTTAEGQKRDADEAAIRQSAVAFTKAFEKGDAKAVAAFWTEQGEHQDESGSTLRGRAEIEKAFAELFKEKTNSKIEVLIESIRFPAPNVAIEEGILRQTGDVSELPSSTFYSVVHVRVNDHWEIAFAREWGAGQDRLEDLEWLAGTWQAKAKDREVTLSLSREKGKPFMAGQFTTKENGKVASTGSMKIALDPQTGQLRSWHFDDDGGHGQALWIRDGNRWVLDAVGVLGDGTDTAALNVLSRISADEITWRSIDRVLGTTQLPDTVPTKLTRVK